VLIVRQWTHVSLSIVCQ